MKVLQCHNFYKLSGGEDHVFRDEGWLLEQYGHEVIRYQRHNQELDKMSPLKMAQSTIWSKQSSRELSDLLRQHKPDIAHFHNTFPLISPSAYRAAQNFGVPVVQTLHNYRMICPSATLLRNKEFCQKCVGKKFAYPSIVHKCYRGSRKASAVTALANAFQTTLGKSTQLVDRFIALGERSRRVFLASGIAAHKIQIKPNFVHPDPGMGTTKEDYAVFVGRLSTEKGIDTLLSAWNGCETNVVKNIPLRIIGEGPMEKTVLRACERNEQIKYLGQLPYSDVLCQIRNARVLVFPSIWNETFGRSMIEAFASGTPVIASNIGSMADIVQDGVNGLHFQAGDASDLRQKLVRLFDDGVFYDRACHAARNSFMEKFTPEINIERLLAIYSEASTARSKTREQTRDQM
ncbi:MAG: glycosyltransferase [Rubripirellula sp.]|nr:glycosyltransferase [Rubripirellula sp.]